MKLVSFEINCCKVHVHIFRFPYLSVALTSFLLLPHFWCVIKNWAFITFDMSQNFYEIIAWIKMCVHLLCSQLIPLQHLTSCLMFLHVSFLKLFSFGWKVISCIFHSQFNILIDIVSMLHSLNEVFTSMLNDYKIFIENHWHWLFQGLKKNDLVFQFLF